MRERFTVCCSRFFAEQSGEIPVYGVTDAQGETIPDITPDRDVAERLCALLAAYNVAPEHLRYVVEDLLAQGLPLDEIPPPGNT